MVPVFELFCSKSMNRMLQYHPNLRSAEDLLQVFEEVEILCTAFGRTTTDAHGSRWKASTSRFAVTFGMNIRQSRRHWP